jgi:hypothetical protein
MSAGRKLYLVVRRTWNTGSTAPNWNEHVPVRACTSRKAADALCRELEDALHRERDVWTLFEGALHKEEAAALREAGVRLGLVNPGAAEVPWNWWHALPAPVTEAQRLALWAAVPALKAYHVTETKLLD